MNAPKLNVSLTKSYRLSSDGERNFTIEQLVTIDPTKAPGWSKRLAADPTLSADPRTEWRDTENYYPMTARGLAAALEFVAIRQAVSDAASEEPITLNAYARIIEGLSEELTQAVSGLLPQIFEEVGA